jgi:hypothetical protein
MELSANPRLLCAETDRVQPSGAAPTLTELERLSAATHLALCLWRKTEPVVSLDELADTTLSAL